MKTSFFLIALFIFSSAYSQQKFTIGVFGGYSLPLSNLKGDFPTDAATGSIDFQNASSYLLKSGFNGGVFGKYTVDSLGNDRITAAFTYNRFSQKKDYLPYGAARTISNNMGIFSVSAGLEYDFKPKAKFNPYAGIELAANFFSGTIEYTGDTLVTLNRSSESRYGVIINAGFEYRIKKTFGVTAGLKYTMFNLIGKTSGSVSSQSNGNSDANTPTTSLVGEIPLNDNDARTQLSRSIIALQIYAGLFLNFGGK